MINKVELGNEYRHLADGDHTIVFVVKRRGFGLEPSKKYPYLLVDKNTYEVLDEYDTLESVGYDLFDAIHSVACDIITAKRNCKGEIRATLDIDKNFQLYVGSMESAFVPYMTNTEYNKMVKLCEALDIEVDYYPKN